MKSILVLLLAISCCALARGEVLSASTPSTISYVDSSAPNTPKYRQFVNSSWVTSANTSTVSSTVDWQIIRNNPKTNELALATISDDRALRLQFWNGSSWGAATTLASDTGNSSDRVYDAEYEQYSGQLLVAYSKTGSNAIYYRTYTTSNPSEQSYAILNAPARWIALAPKSGSDELLMIVATDVNLYGAVWNGSNFGNLTTLETNLPLVGRPWGISYNQAGTGMVVWGANASTLPKYATWNGTAWSTTATMPAVGGTPSMMALKPKPTTSSTELLLAITDSSNKINVTNWNGTAWSAMTTVETAVANAYQPRAGLAYQPNGAGALLVWHTSGQNAVRYRTWSGTSWSGTQTGPNMGSESLIVRLVPGLSSDEVIAAVQCKPAGPGIADYTVYSQSGTLSVPGSAIEGTSGQQIAGISLPTPPAYTVGSTNLTYGNNTAVTLPPGNYGNLSTGNSVTINMSAGTYVFKTWPSPGNHDTLACNTSAGNISIIVATGNVVTSNNYSIINTGGGQVTFHIIAGNFDASNNASAVYATFLCYGGYIKFGNGTLVRGHVYASGNITLGSGTIIDANSSLPPTPGILQVMRWSGGTLGTPSTFSTQIPGYIHREDFALSAPPPNAPSLYITRWHEVGQDE
jgi:hypothetical protein